MEKRHICITGMDGTGKSTIIKQLQKVYPSHYLVHIWELFENRENGLLFHSKRDIDNYLCNLTPVSRLFFLAHAMKYSIDMAYASDREVIISNSYYYKYFASEKVYGAPVELIQSLKSWFQAPDIVIKLETPVKEAAMRKTNYSRYESGQTENPGATDFIAFQLKVAKAWDLFDQDLWHSVSTYRNKKESFIMVVKIVQENICR